MDPKTAPKNSGTLQPGEHAGLAKALQETPDYLHNVVENAFDMIVTTDLDARIVSFNRVGEKLLGYSKDEVIGQSAEIFYADPEERRALMRRIFHFDGGVSNYETRLKRKDGSLVDISLTISLLHDNDGRTIGTVGISRDITGRKRTQAELRNTRDYLNAIVENTPDIIITTDLDKRIVSFNRGAERILGYTRQEVLGRGIEDLYVEPEERQALMKYLAAQGGAANYETQLRAKDGGIVDIDLTLSHLYNNQGEIIGTVGISKDITATKRVERELALKQAELEEAQLQMLHSEKMASLGKLAASIAHEINNPLGGILLFGEMLLEDFPEDDPRFPDLLQIKTQALRCKEILRGLLEFGRMTESRHTLVDLHRTLEQAVTLFAAPSILKDIRIVREYAPLLPRIMGDPGQLIQVFTNLITNAIDAMQSAGTLTLTTSEDKAAGLVRVDIRDTGRGIDPAALPRIFDPFYTSKPVGEGVGLGLSTSLSIIRKHNGRIEVSSRVGAGSSFSVFLPLGNTAPGD